MLELKAYAGNVDIGGDLRLAQRRSRETLVKRLYSMIWRAEWTLGRPSERFSGHCCTYRCWNIDLALHEMYHRHRSR